MYISENRKPEHFWKILGFQSTRFHQNFTYLDYSSGPSRPDRTNSSRRSGTDSAVSIPYIVAGPSGLSLTPHPPPTTGSRFAVVLGQVYECGNSRHGVMSLDVRNRNGRVLKAFVRLTGVGNNRNAVRRYRARFIHFIAINTRPKWTKTAENLTDYTLPGARSMMDNIAAAAAMEMCPPLPNFRILVLGNFWKHVPKGRFNTRSRACFLTPVSNENYGVWSPSERSAFVKVQCRIIALVVVSFQFAPYYPER